VRRIRELMGELGSTRRERDQVRQKVEQLEGELERLREENQRLRNELEAAMRAGKRQAAPFSRCR
jgi:phage shock protein A